MVSISWRRTTSWICLALVQSTNSKGPWAKRSFFAIMRMSDATTASLP